MAITHHKPEPAVSQGSRHYTVGYVPNGGCSNPAPAIHLKGRWLEKAGFIRGTLIRVTQVGEHLVITPLPRQSLLNNMIHQVEHLSEATQQELAQIINRLMVWEQRAGYGAQAAKKAVTHGQD